MCDHVWGTRLELKAAATLFKYLSIAAHNSHCNMMCHFSWSVVQPISLNLKLPQIIDEVVQEREEISHIELFHHNGHIDDCVTRKWEMCTEAPRLTEKDDPNVINVLN